MLGLALYALSDHLLWSHPAVLTFVARYTPAGPDGDPLHVDATLATGRTGAVPLLLLGSSQVREGLDCTVLEAHLQGTPCLNLAISAGSPLDLLTIASRYDARLPRRTTVIGLFPKLLHLPPKSAFVDLGTLQSLLGSESRGRLSARQWLDVSAGLLEQLSPTLRYKDALARWAAVVTTDVRAALDGRLPAAPRRLLAGQAPRPARYFERRLGVLDADALAPGAFSPAQAEALERLLAREVARGGRVFVIDFPTRPGYASTLPGGALTHYQALVRRLAARSDVTLLDIGALGPLSLDDFQDFTHLSASGRAKVSARLGVSLAQAVGAAAHRR